MTIKEDLKLINNILNECFCNLKEQWKNDRIGVKYNFFCLIDSLQKDNEISEKTSENVYLYENKRNEIILTCLSYKIKVA